MSDREDKVSMQRTCEEMQILLDRLLLDELADAVDGDRLKNHLSSCTDCRDFLTLTRRLKQFTPQLTEEKRRTLVAGSHRQFREARMMRDRFRAAIWMSTAVACVALLAVILFRSAPTNPTSTGQQPVSTASAKDRSPRPTIFWNGTAIVAYDGGGEATARTHTGEEIEIYLNSGTVAAKIDHGQMRGRRFSIVTNRVKVVVRGTILSVDVKREQEWIHVLEGRVEVIPLSNNDGERARWVSGGYSVCLDCDDPLHIAPEKQEQIYQMLNIIAPPTSSTNREGSPLPSHPAVETSWQAANERITGDLSQGEPTPGSGYWTYWMNCDSASGHGDAQTLRALIDSGYPVCEKPSHVECRTVSNHRDWRETDDRLICTPQIGLVCLNEDQLDSQCEDYEVRFFCPR